MKRSLGIFSSCRKVIAQFFWYDITHHLKNRPRQNRGRFFQKGKALSVALLVLSLFTHRFLVSVNPPAFYIPPISAQTIKN